LRKGAQSTDFTKAYKPLQELPQAAIF